MSRSDRANEVAFANDLCRRFIRLTGARLIGDPIDLGTNHTSTTEERLARILPLSSGHLMVLPARSSEHEYRHFRKEFEAAKELGLPVLVLAEPNAKIPAPLRDHGSFHEVGEDVDWSHIDDAIQLFGEDVDDHRAVYAPRIFFAFEYKDNELRNSSAFSLLSSCTGLPCRSGRISMAAEPNA